MEIDKIHPEWRLVKVVVKVKALNEPVLQNLVAAAAGVLRVGGEIALDVVIHNAEKYVEKSSGYQVKNPRGFEVQEKVSLAAETYESVNKAQKHYAMEWTFETEDEDQKVFVVHRTAEGLEMFEGTLSDEEGYFRADLIRRNQISVSTDQILTWINARRGETYDLLSRNCKRLVYDFLRKLQCPVGSYDDFCNERNELA